MVLNQISGFILTVEKGLAPLPDPTDTAQQAKLAERVSPGKEAAKNTKATGASLSFSSSKGRPKILPGKRKAVGDPGKEMASGSSKDMPAKKKSKKPSKTLLSFGDDA